MSSNYQELMNKKRKIMNKLRIIQKEIERCPEYKEPSRKKLSERIYHKQLDELIIDDMIVINQIKRRHEIFSFFY